MFSGSRDRITSSEKTLAPKSCRIDTFFGGNREGSPLTFFPAIEAMAFWRTVAISMSGLQQQGREDRGRVALNPD